MWKYFIFILSFYCSLAYGKSEQKKKDDRWGLEYLQIVTSNGHYAPIKLYNKDRNSERDWWPTELGGLTKLGKLQHFEFGKFLRKMYRDFITSSPYEVDSFSAADDRSVQSLMCLQASLYAPTGPWQFVPGFKWQPTGLFYFPQPVTDTFFNLREICYNQIVERNRHRSSQAVLEHIQKDEFLYSYWTNHSGSTIKTWTDVAELYDTISKELQAGLKVPYWAGKYLRDMKRITDHAYTWNCNSTLCLQFKVGSLIDLLTVRMRVKALTEHNPDPEIVLSVYLTHDWNIAALLSAMRLSNGLRPPPCATLIFEMLQRNNEYSIRTLFFNSTIPEYGYQERYLLVLDGCTEFCPLSAFVQFFHDVIPEDSRKLCGTRMVEIEPNLYQTYYDPIDNNDEYPL